MSAFATERAVISAMERARKRAVANTLRNDAANDARQALDGQSPDIRADIARARIAVWTDVLAREDHPVHAGAFLAKEIGRVVPFRVQSAALAEAETHFARLRAKCGEGRE